VRPEQARPSDQIALFAIICGVAPLPLTLLSMIPFVGCLTSPLTLLCVPGAIGFGIAGIVRARSQPEPNYVLPVTGLALGVIWIVLALVIVVVAFAGGNSFMERALNMRGH
jgi:hypothetical protein